MAQPRRPLEYRDFDALSADLHHLRGRPYQRAGAWSLGQICEHLATFITLSIDGFPFRLPWYMRASGPIVKFVTLRSRRMPAGIRTLPDLKPPQAPDDTQAIDRLLATLNRYRHHTAPLAPSPLLGRLTRPQWDQLHLIHAAHHLSFILPVPSQPAMPSSS